MSSSTGAARANGRVLAVAGDVGEQVVRGERRGSTELADRRRARACLWRSPCALWRARARLGTLVQACLVHKSIEQRV
jgi:hypothetical protein